MKKIKPYLILAGTVIVILAIYKIVIQPRLPASVAGYLPTV